MSRSTFTRAYDGSSACGDFVEYIDLGNGTSAALIGDIAGRGLEASIAARRLHAYVRSRLCSGMPLPELVDASNVFFDRCLLNDITPFASLFIATMNERTPSVTYVSAGHETALLVSGAHHTHLAATGPLLGLREWDDSAFREASLTFDDGAMLVVVTDGITDAREPGRGAAGTFGSCGVLNAVLRTTSSLQDLSHAVYTSAVDHAHGDLQDDASVLIVVLGRLPLASAPVAW